MTTTNPETLRDLITELAPRLGGGGTPALLADYIADKAGRVWPLTLEFDHDDVSVINGNGERVQITDAEWKENGYAAYPPQSHTAGRPWPGNQPPQKQGQRA